VSPRLQVRHLTFYHDLVCTSSDGRSCVQLGFRYAVDPSILTLHFEVNQPDVSLPGAWLLNTSGADASRVRRDFSE
jgi:hypothetical protein